MNEVIHRVYPGGGYEIRRTYEPLTQVVCCMHCRGTGRERAANWAARVAYWVAYQGVIVGRQEWPCCVCRGRGYFRVPAEGEQAPPACN